MATNSKSTKVLKLFFVLMFEFDVHYGQRRHEVKKKKIHQGRAQASNASSQKDGPLRRLKKKTFNGQRSDVRRSFIYLFYFERTVLIYIVYNCRAPGAWRLAG
jgi:hypothetical protein